jgi:FkbM family methyltransferase
MLKNLINYNFLFYFLLAFFLLTLILYSNNINYFPKSLKVDNNKEKSLSNSVCDLLWHELFKLSEEQKLIDNEILYKTFDFMNKGTSEDDPELIKFVKSIIIPPSSKELNLDQKSKTDFSQYGQSVIIDSLLKSKRNGFIVEAGAFDGEIESNSLFFEINRNWTGILIEPIPSHFQKILAKNRKMNKINACISKNKPAVVKFLNDRTGSSPDKLDNNFFKSNIDNYVQTKKGNDRIFVFVPCFSLHTILTALNVKQVDYFSLDVEGSEMNVLNSIDFNRTYFKTITVEHFFLSEPDLVEFMKKRNFSFQTKGRADHFFINNS